VWTTNKEAEARAYQRYALFLKDPRAYWQEMLGLQGTRGAFYEEIGRTEPNPGHYALAGLEALGILKCVITQNIDGLPRTAGSRRILEYHGSIHPLRRISCGSRLAREEVSTDELPPLCKCDAALRHDVVHFKEPIPLDVMRESEEEALRCDLMLICGTSAVVYPFANLPRMVRLHSGGLVSGLDVMGCKANVRIIEVNAEPTPLTHEGVSDCLIQGQTGEILPRIVGELRTTRKQRS